MKLHNYIMMVQAMIFLNCGEGNKEEINKTNGKSEMSVTYKPEGYSTISPFFVVEGAEQFTEFVKEVLDAEQISRFDHEDGSIYHLELKIDDTVIMISEARGDFPANHALTHVYVTDASDAYKKAIEKGATPIDEPVVAEGDTDERGMFKDPFGNIWAVATHGKDR